jgi:hypothetical protein
MSLILMWLVNIRSIYILKKEEWAPGWKAEKDKGMVTLDINTNENVTPLKVYLSVFYKYFKL